MATSPRPVPSARSGAGTLTGPDLSDLLQAALGEEGGELVSWRVNHIDHRPGRRSFAAYQAQVRRDDGQVGEQRFGACTEPADSRDAVAVWRFPHDPFLPGLAAASHRVKAAGLLRRFGIGEGPAGLELRAYRPGRRAVVEAIGPGRRLFLHVVPPDRVAGLHWRHRVLTAAGLPTALSLGQTDTGVVLVPSLPGQTLRAAVRGGNEPLPTGQDVLDLLDRLPQELVEGAPVRSSAAGGYSGAEPAVEQPEPSGSWPARAERQAAVVAELLPAEAERVRRLAAAIAAEAIAGPTVPVHGDFSEHRIQVAGGRITGLLGIDAAGAGERVDDLAGLLGHLSVLGHDEPEPARAAAIGRLGAQYLRSFEPTVDPAQLRLRTAAVVLSVATTPYQVQELAWRRLIRRRLDLAERWLDSARSLGVEWSAVLAGSAAVR